MFKTPDQVDELELLDSAKVPLKKRIELLNELDSTNSYLQVYYFFLKAFKLWLNTNNQLFVSRERPLKILEIGSGSGGLAVQILNSQKTLNFQFDYSIMDMDPEILNWAQINLQEKGFKVETFSSGETHLEQFSNNQFDIIISLHVLHHIQPVEILEKMFTSMSQVAKLGFFMADFDRRWGIVSITKVANFLLKTSRDLAEDGDKSVKRAYTHKQMHEAMSHTLSSDWVTNQKVYNLFPYQIISGTKKPNKLKS